MDETVRLLNTGHQDGYNNMAIDGAMFTLMADNGTRPTLRIYGWSPPAISIGYFQKIEEAKPEEVAMDKGIDIVRRLTGGGAILHNQELTFCLVTRIKDSIIPEDVFASYDFISRAVIRGLQSLGIPAQIRGGEAVAKKQTAFFCFDRSSKYDIIFKGKKIAGSAQRRRNGVLLHHGSVLLDEQNLNGSTCINSILNRKVGFEELGGNIINGFEKELSANLVPGKMTEQELQLSRQLAINAKKEAK